jgi:hypothetical protein
VFLTASSKVKAPDGTMVFDKAWKSYKSVVLSETGGINRVKEPTEVLLAFYPDEALQLSRDIRVVEVDAKTHALTEVPSQVYDIQESLAEDNLAPDKNVFQRVKRHFGCQQFLQESPFWQTYLQSRVAYF